jgi:hypothetical protein
VAQVEPKPPPVSRRAPSELGSTTMSFAPDEPAATVASLREAGVDVIADPEPYLLDSVRSNSTYLPPSLSSSS